MRFLSETTALTRLSAIRDGFRQRVVSEYELRAKDCSTCETQGVCCTDEHFVNVRITQLEAAAIKCVIDNLDVRQKQAVRERVNAASEKISSGTEFFACPLYVKGTGCLVHDQAKPMPCIFHACYESRDDLPPEELLDDAEAAVADLNTKTYGVGTMLPIPTALANTLRTNSNAADGRRAPSSDRASERK
ncbi:MAG: hypothetical protein KF881_01185 [Acidobacteria bacterium]|nr:hypothetical protein [Acidobacteriota bacterium]